MAAKFVYLVTGAGSGIGAAIAKCLAKKDVMLILHTQQNKAGLQALTSECEAQGAQVYCHYGDLAQKTTIDNIVACLTKQSAHLNGLICNAGFPDWRSFDQLDQIGLSKSYSVIIAASFALLTQCTPFLISARGRVVAVSSFLAHKFKVGQSIVPASAMAKAGLEAMVKSYAGQYAHQGVNANIIVPGYIKKNGPDHKALDDEALQKIKDRIPKGALGLPEDVANLAEFLLSDKANYITGQAIHIDGGLLLS